MKKVFKLFVSIARRNLFVTLVLLVPGCSSYSQGSPSSENGVLDLTQHDFEASPASLSGHWFFFPEKLLNREACLSDEHVDLLVPGLWNETLPAKGGKGYGTYFLQLAVPEAKEPWALYIPQLYNSYTLWVNDSLIASAGEVGPSIETTIPQWKPQVAVYNSTADTLSIVLHIANFHHFKGGIREPLYFGNVSGIQSDYKLSITGTLIACIFLFSLSVVFLIYYFRHPGKNIAAAYSMLCLCWAIRSMFSNLYPVTIFLPDFDWYMLVRVEYFSLYLIMIFSVMLLNQLFQELGSAVFNSVMILINLLFFLFTLISEPTAFTRWLPLYLATAVLVIAYGLVIVFRALIHEKKGSWPLIGGMCMMILLTGYEIIAYKGLLGSNQFLSSIGFIILFTFLTVGVLQYLGILKTDASGSELTYNDLYKKDK